MNDTIKKAIEFFGTTFDLRETGYILLDGKCLDFSGKRDGGQHGQRAMDHREIAEVTEENDGTQAMIEFINLGNIRFMPECGGIELSLQPTAEQFDIIRRIVNYFKGEVIVDIADKNGNIISSTEYNLKTSSSKIVNDIKFATNILKG